MVRLDLPLRGITVLGITPKASRRASAAFADGKNREGRATARCRGLITIGTMPVRKVRVTRRKSLRRHEAHERDQLEMLGHGVLRDVV